MSENELEVFCLKLNCPGFACKCKKEEISRLTQDNAGCKELRQEFDGLIAVSNRLTQELEAARGENEKYRASIERIVSHCGIPSMAKALRSVLDTAKEVLGDGDNGI